MDLYEELKAKKIGGAASGGFTPTEQQLVAMNSGITSTDVAQINTNKNSITDIKDGTSINSFGDVEDALDDKADKSATYTKTEVDTALDSKANTSDIPTVPIAAIQKNGTGITPVSGTVNITVPTTATDVSALPDTTKYATTLSLTINSSTFVMTGQLKDQNGDNLGTAQTIDLPLESVVVGGSYNSQTKKVVLTLQNGNTIEFSVADLVSGLQTELSASNKLNPAYIDYDSTHRAVSDTEKSTWNGKQNAIDSSHKLSADLVDDTNAINKFATAEELEQIQTNKNNILLKSNAENTAYKTAATSFGGTNMQCVFNSAMFTADSRRGSVLMMFGTQKASVNNTLLMIDFNDTGIRSIRRLSDGTSEVITAIGAISSDKQSFAFTADGNSYTYPCLISMFANKDIKPNFTIVEQT